VIQGAELPREFPKADPTLDVALVVPLHGSAGIFGPSCELCGQLAAEEVNTKGGVLARELRLVAVDGSGPPQRVADEVGALVASGLVDAVVGWHISAVRQAIAPRVAGRVPYVYTALYEGGEHTPGVFMAGETPARQLLPAMRWLRAQYGVRNWCIVGDDYVWPRITAKAARAYAELCDGRISEEIFIPLGTTEFGHVLERVESCGADAVLMLLVGEDAVHFNRAFAEAGLHDRSRRLSTLMDENMLLASGAGSTRGICATAAYFESLTTPESLDFGWRYTQRFGPDAPILNSLGESCYEGVKLLAELVRSAGSTQVPDVCAVADSVSYEGARGLLRIHDRHLVQPVYLSVADGLEFDVLCQLEPQPADA
jgi:ABC-type branched-subunit amino acid transport system substrate-binding protein